MTTRDQRRQLREDYTAACKALSEVKVRHSTERRSFAGEQKTDHALFHAAQVEERAAFETAQRTTRDDFERTQRQSRIAFLERLDREHRAAIDQYEALKNALSESKQPPTEHPGLRQYAEANPPTQSGFTLATRSPHITADVNWWESAIAALFMPPTGTPLPTAFDLKDLDLPLSDYLATLVPRT